MLPIGMTSMLNDIGQPIGMLSHEEGHPPPPNPSFPQFYSSLTLHSQLESSLQARATPPPIFFSSVVL